MEHTTRPAASPPGVGGASADPLASAIEHDPGDPLHVELVTRCVALARKGAALQDREAEPEDVLLVLQSVSATRNGTAIDRSLIDVSRTWLVTTLSACDPFERDLDSS